WRQIRPLPAGTSGNGRDRLRPHRSPPRNAPGRTDSLRSFSSCFCPSGKKSSLRCYKQPVRLSAPPTHGIRQQTPMAEADPQLSEDEAPASEESVQVPEKRRWGRLALMLAVPAALLVGGLVYWQSLQGKVSTDNAYLKQDMVGVSAEVVGKIVEVAVREGDRVKAGDLLFRIDPEPYRLQIREANAAIATAQANLTTLSNAPELTGVDIAAAREDIAFAQATLTRQEALWRRGFTTKADYEAAQHAGAQARGQLRQAQARQQEARARLAEGPAVPGENPQIAGAKARRAEAELALRRTEVRAPIAGRVAQADRLQLGQQAVTSLPMLTI